MSKIQSDLQHTEVLCRNSTPQWRSQLCVTKNVRKVIDFAISDTMIKKIFKLATYLMTVSVKWLVETITPETTQSLSGVAQLNCTYSYSLG